MRRRQADGIAKSKTPGSAARLRQVVLGDKGGCVHCCHTATGAAHSLAANQAGPPLFLACC